MKIRTKRGARRTYNAIMNKAFRAMKGGLSFGMGLADVPYHLSRRLSTHQGNSRRVPLITGVTMSTRQADHSGWSYQTGDNSFTGGAYGYPFWGIAVLTRDTDSQAFAEEILTDLENQTQGEHSLFFKGDNRV